MPLKILSLFSFLLFSFSSWSLSFDWSGFTRIEAYYQDPKVHKHYANYHFVLQPRIHVIDGLNILSRFELISFKEKELFSSSPFYRQTGLMFIYGEGSQQKDLEFSSPFLGISQLYFNYETDLFKLLLGRAPYHFGIGTSYSASQDPFQHWISVYNQATVYFEHSKFYFQPALLHQEIGSFLGIAQAGILDTHWKVEALYQNDFKDSSLLEVFAYYKHVNWEIKSSLTYVLEQEMNMALALEASVDIPSSFPLKLEVKAGGAVGGFAFHPNYNVALLLWNRDIQDIEVSSEETFQVAQGQIQNGIYFSPSLLLSFLNDNLKIRPLGLFSRDLKEKVFHYELDIEAMYRLDGSLFLSLKGGALYKKEFQLALLAQAAVSF